MFLRRCAKEDFAALDVVITGAEALPPDVADSFQERFGVRPVEGYGCTETSPLVSVNVPESRSLSKDQPVCKAGTVGRPIGGVAVKITHPETGAIQPAGEAGMLWVKGPNIMMGYYERPDLTAKAVVDGWYRTGDLALVDAEGFLKITGRESRFSKIGGEMVPHIMVEQLLQKIVAPGVDEVRAVVSAVADPKRGERLVVLHLPMEMAPEAVCQALGGEGIPNLWIPSADSFALVEKIPVLGTGKVDLRGVKELAEAKFGAGAAVS
jgi:acyl-[acyl-carrier-protein]-phospholipid O-acyltransferase/long-chain-fatty-acid--[acyl-carrier-protein] ligase